MEILANNGAQARSMSELGDQLYGSPQEVDISDPSRETVSSGSPVGTFKLSTTNTRAASSSETVDRSRAPSGEGNKTGDEDSSCVKTLVPGITLPKTQTFPPPQD